MTRAHRSGLIVAALVLALDQGVKALLAGPAGLRDRGLIPVMPLFDFRWAQNRGVSMGLLTANTVVQQWLLIALTAVLATGVLVWLLRETRRGDCMALGMILGGAFGNILDRLRLGYVVDYADLHIGEWRPFFIFNLADACISIGVLIVLARALLLRDKVADPKESVHG